MVARKAEALFPQLRLDQTQNRFQLGHQRHRRTGWFWVETVRLWMFLAFYTSEETWALCCCVGSVRTTSETTVLDIYSVSKTRRLFRRTGILKNLFKWNLQTSEVTWSNRSMKCVSENILLEMDKQMTLFQLQLVVHHFSIWTRLSNLISLQQPSRSTLLMRKFNLSQYINLHRQIESMVHWNFWLMVQIAFHIHHQFRFLTLDWLLASPSLVDNWCFHISALRFVLSTKHNLKRPLLKVYSCAICEMTYFPPVYSYQNCPG